MRVLTSITLHNTSEGQRISYTFSDVNEITGTIISENNRSSMVVLQTPVNEVILSNIESVKSYVNERIGE